ncbi:hypothetical protein F2Q70_00033209 [Brassica cretica]|uniref:HSF-type DNA-binding domain-containing protein n=1 Tax=Brassica cretica TaxID=69181 RepID=A0A8S9FVL0_BRACR|nr:hypothetical protein F2Q70_00033209 [Brassica cretica]
MTVVHAFVKCDLFPNDVAIAISAEQPKQKKWFKQLKSMTQGLARRIVFLNVIIPSASPTLAKTVMDILVSILFFGGSGELFIRTFEMEFTRDEAFDRALLRDIKDRVFYFLKKAYAIVNDPSTDSMISWGPNGNSLIVHRPLPLEYTESFLFHSGALSMERFVAYGFTMTVSGSQVEYANDDFVRGQPERLEKICDPFVARMKQDNELRIKLNNDRKRQWQEYSSYGMVAELFKHIYSVVDDPATNSFISWGPNGKSFIVLDPQKCACYCFPYNLLEECVRFYKNSVWITNGICK